MKIELIGNEKNKEYSAAIKLKEYLSNSFINTGFAGEILIISPAICYGQETKEIDILVICKFEKGVKYSLDVKAYDPSTKGHLPKQTRNVYVSNLIIAIELKDHNENSVQFIASNAKVYTGNKWHDATHQSDEQKYAVKNYLETTTGYSPWVFNLIWFRNLTKEDFPKVPHNWLPNIFDFKWILYLLCEQRPPIYKNNYHNLSSSIEKDNDISFFKKTFELFTTAKTNVGKLTRSKLERITKTLLKDQIYAQSIGEKLVVINGRAGTGKTIKLLHIAHDLYKNKEKRCLILTYNKALVSDILRILALADISSKYDQPTISVRTIHSFIFEILNELNIINESNSSQFLNLYENMKNDFLEFWTEKAVDESKIQEYKNKFSSNWDYILVDESQDWPENEKNILFNLFGSNNMIIADGVDQMVRNSKRIDWTKDIQFYKPPGEKKSMRQKANLSRFIKSLTAELNIDWDVEPEENLPGGKIYIINGDYNQIHHKMLNERLVSSENSPYEMLFISPPNLVDENGFKLKKEININFWDGTVPDNRSHYPTDISQYRVVQYDSSRGLEGCVVVCLDINGFYDYKVKTYKENDNTENEQTFFSLPLTSKEENAKVFANRWLTIPFTRAIDTCVIQITNKEHFISKIIYQIAQRNTEFIEIL